MKMLYILISLVLLVSIFAILYPPNGNIEGDELLAMEERITKSENIVECLEEHNHKTYFT